MKSLIALLAFAMISATSLADGPVRHVVHFKFRKDATPEQIQNICDQFAALPQKIKVIDGFEWGTNSSPEGLDKGYTHCWVLDFASEKARDFYLEHPAHKEFAAIAKPLIADVLVVDFVPAKTRRPTRSRQNIDGKVERNIDRGIDRAWGAQKTG
jgi:hypothetical protein